MSEYQPTSFDETRSRAELERDLISTSNERDDIHREMMDLREQVARLKSDDR